MAKAILEFDLNDSDDAMHHLRAVKSTDMAMVLWELAYNSKKRILNTIEENGIKEPDDAIELFYEKFFEEMNTRGIFIDDLIQ